jgi:hypothetical protein
MAITERFPSSHLAITERTHTHTSLCNVMADLCAPLKGLVFLGSAHLSRLHTATHGS